jgi:hypothetical protein
MPNCNEKPLPIEKTKKDYSSPKLVVYGSLSDLTRGVGSHGNDDGGSGMTSKTQP